MAYEEWGDLSSIKAAPLPPEAPSLLGRIGERGANIPSDIINEIMGLGHSVGVTPERMSVPVPYDIPEAPGLFTPEGAIDVAAGFGEAAPLFMTGEAAGVGLARLMRLGPVASRVARMTGGFGLSDLSTSPEHGAIGAGVGGLMGAAESVPGVLPRVLSAAALGAASYLSGKHAGATDTQAKTQAAVNVLLSQILRHGPKKPAIPSEGGNAATAPDLGPPRLTYPDILQGRVIPREPTYGGELPGRPLALGGGDRLPTIEGDFTMEQPRLEGPVAPLQLEGRAPVPKAPPPEPVTQQVSPAPERPKMTMPELLAVLGVPETARPPEPPRPPLAPIAPRRPEPPAPPRPPLPPRQPGEPLMTDMEQMRGSGFTEEPVLKGEGSGQVAKPSRLLLKTPVTAENAQQAAEKLGLEFQGAYRGEEYGPLNGGHEFKILSVPKDHPAYGANITLTPGATFKDLKNRVAQKIKDFEAGASFTETSKPSGEVATLQPEVAAASPPSPLETGAGVVGENPLARRGEPGYIPTADVIRRAKELVGPEEFQRLAEERIVLTQAASEGTRAIAIERAARKIVAKDMHSRGELPPAPEGHRLMNEIIAETDQGPAGEMAKLRLQGEAIPQLRDTERSGIGAGSVEDVEKIRQERQAESGKMKLGDTGGTMRKSNFGEHGFTIPENLEALTKFIVGPFIGGSIGAATADKDNRGAAIFYGMLAGGFGMH